MSHWQQTALVAALLVVSVITDIGRRKIYNNVVAPAAAMGFALNIWLFGWRGIGVTAAGLGVGLGVMTILYAVGAVGGGDAKLFAAIGAISGWRFAVNGMVFALVANGLLAAIWLAFGRRLGDVLWKIGFAGDRALHGKIDGESVRAFAGGPRAPFAPAAAVGCTAAFFVDIVGLILGR